MRKVKSDWKLEFKDFVTLLNPNWLGRGFNKKSDKIKKLIEDDNTVLKFEESLDGGLYTVQCFISKDGNIGSIVKKNPWYHDTVDLTYVGEIWVENYPYAYCEIGGQYSDTMTALRVRKIIEYANNICPNAKDCEGVYHFEKGFYVSLKWLKAYVKWLNSF